MGKSMASIVAGLALLFAAGLSVGRAQQAPIQLLSPKDGEVVGPNVSVKWKLKNAENVDHFHVYVDGVLRSMEFGTSAELTGLSNGPHMVRIIAATKSHQEIGPEANVKVSVKGTGAPATAPPPPKRSYGY